MKGLVPTSAFIGAALAAALLGGCSGGGKSSEESTTTTTSTTTNTVAQAPAQETPAAAPAPTADSTDTLSGAKLAQFTGNPDAGKTVFVTCQTCHSGDAGQNRIGPSLHAVVGRHSGSVEGFNYSPANRNSGITWTPEKLFQYLEDPQRVVPGTKMSFAGISDPQRRADVIAYLGTLK